MNYPSLISLALAMTLPASAASVDDPEEISITNANFDGNISGWETNLFNYYGGSYYKNTYEDVSINNFAEKYNGSGIGTGYIQQTVENLAEGYYLISADAACIKGGDEYKPASGVVFFAQTSSDAEATVAVHSEKHQPSWTETINGHKTECNSSPRHFAINAYVGSEGKLTFGFRATNSNAIWMAVDNFKLIYYGTDASAVKQLVADSKALVSANKGNATLLQALSTATTAAETALNESNVTNAVVASLTTAKNAVDEYTTAYTALAYLKSRADQYDADHYNTSSLEAFLQSDDSNRAYADIINEQPYDIYAVYDYRQKLKDLISSTGCTFTASGTDITSKTITSADFSSTSGWEGAKVNSGVAEFYNTSGELYQDLTVPNGEYEVAVNAMQRVGFGFLIEGFLRGTEQINATLYANDESTTLKSILDEHTYGIGSRGYEGDYYVDNCSQFASAAAKGYYSNYVRVTVTDGKLRIGLKSTQPTAGDGTWMLADNARLSVLSYTLDEATANTLLATDGVKAQLKRTLSSEYWNTFCVPFAIPADTIAKVFGKGTLLRKYDKHAGTTLYFTETDQIEAGVAYLIKPAITVTDPSFEGVTIVEGEPASGTDADGYGFCGLYSPKDDLATDGTNLFVTTKGKVSKPAEGATKMKGLRAYIVVPGSDAAKAVTLSLDGETTPIRTAAANGKAGEQTAYNLQGQRLTQDAAKAKGLWIVNGKKVIRK